VTDARRHYVTATHHEEPRQVELGVDDQAECGQLETFIGDAKISRKQSPADGHETLSEGVAWFDFH
jgi:hypothetical protein